MAKVGKIKNDGKRKKKLKKLFQIESISNVNKKNLERKINIYMRNWKKGKKKINNGIIRINKKSKRTSEFWKKVTMYRKKSFNKMSKNITEEIGYELYKISQ